MNLPRLTAAASIYNQMMPLSLLYRAMATSGLAPRKNTVSLAADSCRRRRALF
jgi:hypothetical protein